MMSTTTLKKKSAKFIILLLQGWLLNLRMRERLWTKHYVNSCDTDRTLFPPPLEAKKQKNQKIKFFWKKKLFCFFLLPLSECNCNARWNCCEQRRIKNFLWRNTLPRAIDGIKLITLILRGAWIILFLNHFFQ